MSKYWGVNVTAIFLDFSTVYVLFFLGGDCWRIDKFKMSIIFFFLGLLEN